MSAREKGTVQDGRTTAGAQASEPWTTEWAHIDDEQDPEVLLAAYRPVVLAFEGGDCGHCRDQRALLSLAWRQLGWRLTARRVDVGRMPALAEQHHILGYPTLLVFSAGRVVARAPGRVAPRNSPRSCHTCPASPHPRSQKPCSPGLRSTRRRVNRWARPAPSP